MINKINQQQDIIPAAISHYNIAANNICIFYSSTSGKTKYKFVRHKDSNIDRISLKQNTKDYSSLKKGYIMQSCEYTKEKIKECAKLRNIKITKNLEDADFVVIPKNIRNHSVNLSSRSDYYSGSCYIRIPDNLTDNSCISESWRNAYSTLRGTLYSVPFINIMYRVSQFSLKLVDCIDFCHVGTELTVDIVDQLESQISNGQYDLVNELIPRLISSKEHIIWYASKKLQHYFYRTRSKKVRNWFNTYKAHANTKLTAYEKLINLERKNILTSESFIFLEKQIRKDIYVIDGGIYNFKFTLKPKYHKYYEKESFNTTSNKK